MTRVPLKEFLEYFTEPHTTVNAQRRFNISGTAVLKRIKKLHQMGYLKPVGETKTRFKGYVWVLTDKGRAVLEKSQ
jgi:DNA-binding MarR family transcriptional regulator